MAGLPPQIVDFQVDPGASIKITYQSIPGEVFGDRGSHDLASFPAILPNTPAGDGTVMQHTVPASGSRFFVIIFRLPQR